MSMEQPGRARESDTVQPKTDEEHGKDQRAAAEPSSGARRGSGFGANRGSRAEAVTADRLR